MSNCINSGIRKIFILTQFNSASLNRHIARIYNFGNGVNFGDGFVEVGLFRRILYHTCILYFFKIWRKNKSGKRDQSWWMKANSLHVTGSGCHSNTRGSRTEVVPRNSRCCEAIYMGFWGGFLYFSTCIRKNLGWEWSKLAFEWFL